MYMHIYSKPLTHNYHFLMCVQLNESDFKALVVTDDSSVVLNQLHVAEQGTYRCSLQGRNGTVFYRVTFLLTGRVQLLYMISQKLSLKGQKATTHAQFLTFNSSNIEEEKHSNLSILYNGSKLNTQI